MEDREKALEQLLANSNKWQEFVGIKNSKDCVLRKASALARSIVSQELGAVDALQSLGVSFGISKNDRQWWDVYYDHLIYYMHIADREAFEFLEENRGIFMERLLKEIVEICSADFKDKKQNAQFKARFFENFNLFQKEFNYYKRGGSEPLSEQLQYQFGKRIASRLGLDISFCMVVVSSLVAGEILLNIPGLLTGKSWTKEKGLVEKLNRLA